MLVNAEKNNNERHVEFVSYTGKYPNLCNGVLTLRIDGVEHTFGCNYEAYPMEPAQHEAFWCSGGGVYLVSDDWDFDVQCGEWQINADKLPEELREYADEINSEFNSNVDYGCCGGCI